jgi:hypothetical protein
MTLQVTQSLTLKIWDESTMDRTLESVAEALAARTVTPGDRVVVVASGPRTFTISVELGGSDSHTLQEVPC